MNKPLQRPAPETDAEWESTPMSVADLNWANFARTLERQRDEAREQVRRLRDALIRVTNELETFGDDDDDTGPVTQSRTILAETKEAE